MPASSSPARVAIDTGGTFTDLVFEDAAGIRVHKLPSTPEDPSQAVLGGWRAIDPDGDAERVLHGSTVGLNALLTRRGARTALVTNRGFADVLQLGRGHRPQLYDLDFAPLEPLIPPELRFEVNQRSDENGKELTRPEDAELTRLVKKLRRAKVESVAVLFLHSWRDPKPERRIGRALKELGVPISLSSEVLPRFREVERGSATTINAYLVPIMGAYLERLRKGFGKRALGLLQNHGGLVRAATAAKRPLEVLFSGPAGGVVGGSALALELGAPRVLTFDMGGTSTDVCVAGEHAERSDEVEVGGMPLGLPSLDLHTVGCGGGSIAWADEGGALKVGPMSAGADPGPACYGRGEEPTLTDAHLLLGRLPEGSFLSGALQLDKGRARRAYEKLGKKLGLSAHRAAEGALRIADVAMMRALKVISLERGIDPTRCPLIAFGGAGGLHAARLVTLLRLPSAVLPPDPGAFSARGMLSAVVLREWTRSVALLADPAHTAALRKHRDELGRIAQRGLREELGDGRQPELSFRAALRYRGQSWELELPLGNDPAADFHRAHAELYGFRLEDTPVEVVHLTVEAREPIRAVRSAKARRPRPRSAPTPSAKSGSFAVHRRADLAPGTQLEGPALVVEYSATTVVEAGFTARVDGAGNLHLLPPARST